MARQHSYDLANSAVFQQRVYGALLVYANTVGAEAAKPLTQWTEKRYLLLRQVLVQPDEYADRFARAAAGNAAIVAAYVADAGATPDAKQAAVTDNVIDTFVAAAWDVVAGVMPVDKGT